MAPAPRARKPLKVGSKPKKQVPPEAPRCEVGDLFRVLGKAHVLDILHAVMTQPEGRPMRFVDLQHQLRMSPNTLSERLRELVEAGFLTRTAYNEIPPRVDYAPTDKARDLRAVFETLESWAGKHDLRPEAAAEPGPTAPASASAARAGGARGRAAGRA